MGERHTHTCIGAHPNTLCTQVLENIVPHQRMSDELAQLLRTCSCRAGVAQVEAAGETPAEWTLISLRKSLTLLCREADAFREALLHAVQQSGGGKACRLYVDLFIAQR